MERVIADTGFLVAAGRAADPLHAAARRFSTGFKGGLVTVSPVIVEACHFLNAQSRLDLLAAVGPRLMVVEVPVRSYPELAGTLRKYADQDLDFADAAIAWLSEHSGLRRLLTVDQTDFSVLRLKGGRRFELIEWY